MSLKESVRQNGLEYICNANRSRICFDWGMFINRSFYREF